MADAVIFDATGLLGAFAGAECLAGAADGAGAYDTTGAFGGDGGGGALFAFGAPGGLGITGALGGAVIGGTPGVLVYMIVACYSAAKTLTGRTDGWWGIEHSEWTRLLYTFVGHSYLTLLWDTLT